MKNLVSKAFLIVLAIALVVGPVGANDVRTRTIHFKGDPTRSMNIMVGSGQVMFELCTKGQGCTPFGKYEGYRAEALEKRYKQLRRKKWVRRAVVYPLGSLCSGLLMGGYAAFALTDLFELSGEIIESAPENLENWIEEEPVTGILLGPTAAGAQVAVGAGVGILAGTISFTYGLIGSMLGLPGTWVGVRLFRPSWKKAQKALKQARLDAITEDENVTLGISPQKYLRALEYALEGVE